jgi:hypothetical protein
MQVHVYSNAWQELAEIKMRLAFMDFETLTIAIPRYAGMTPWQHVPMQFSVHQLSPNGLDHFEFLAEADGSDPRPAFIEKLLEAAKSAVRIAVWSTYEKKLNWQKLFRNTGNSWTR